MNVIWVTADTLRRDDVGAYGNKVIRTPSIDAFAEKSVRFDNHYIASFPTMPARADFLTGRWSMLFMQWEPLPEEEVKVVLPELLANKGINTAAFVDTPFYTRLGMNYDRGFRTFVEIPGQLHYDWVDSIGGNAGGNKKVDPIKGRIMHRQDGGDVREAWRHESDHFAPQTFIKAMQWLESHYKEDFFLYIDTWDPHEAWDAPNYYTELYYPGYDGEIIKPVYGYWQDAPGYTEEKVKKVHATYRGEVTMVDTWFGYFMRKVENMGLLENTAIIFTTDHGFYFGEHGGLLGKMTRVQDTSGMSPGDIFINSWMHSPLYEELTHIPLLIYVPNVSPSTYNGLTSAVDLMPTVMDVMGQGIPSRVQGKSLLPMVKDQSLAGRKYVVSAHSFVNAGGIVRSIDGFSRPIEKDTLVTITTDEWSLVYDVEPGLSELYCLASDPKQDKNVIAEHPDVARELHGFLVKLMHEANLSKSLLEPRLELRL